MIVIVVIPCHITVTFVTVIHDIITLFLFYWVQNKKKKGKKKDKRIEKIKRT